MSRLSLLDAILALVTGATVVATLVLLGQRRQMAQGYRSLPGPVPLPFVGNMFSIDMGKPWVTYANWTARYGGIFKVRLMNQDIIVINSDKVAKELLFRRARIYSDRPYLASRIPFGWDFNIGFQKYGNYWRSQRRIFNQTFRADNAINFHPLELKGVRQLVLDILKTPDEVYTLIQKFTGSIFMTVVFDYEVFSRDDHIVDAHNGGSPFALERLSPENATVLRAFPFLLSLPIWFPGSLIRQRADLSRGNTNIVISDSFDHVERLKADGSNGSAMALTSIKKIKGDNPTQLQLVKDTCGTAFIVGSGALGTALQYFIIAMVENQEVQKRAQEEIDAVVGTDRLPGFNDRPKLPYFEALLVELMRRYPILPLNIAHATTEDDVYEGYFIPKGSTVVGNTWAMHHDEDVYPEPFTFKPERFLVDGKVSEKFIDSLSFGFGRRQCPGRFVSDGAFWIATVTILAAFKIMKQQSEEGKEVDWKPLYSSGVVAAPLPFLCTFKPRLPEAELHELATTQET